MLKKSLFLIIILILSVFFLLILIFLRRILLQRSARSLNLILITVDALRADHMGVYGYNKNTTPFIDQWAKKATVFSNAVTEVPLTTPSIIAFMAGLTPQTTRFIKNFKISLGDNVRVLPEILKDNRFTTVAFVNNIFLFKDYSDFSRGFDQYFEVQKDATLSGRLEYDNYIDKVVDWLSANKKKRFFLWVHLMEPHAPYSPPDNLICRFNEVYCDTSIVKFSPELIETKRKKLEGCQDKPLIQADLDLFQALYDGEVATSDFLVGKIFEAVRGLGLNKKSIVVLSTDHGEGFDHNYYFKHAETLYHGTVRIPLIIKHPLSSPNNTNNFFIENTDLFPTLLDLLAIPRSNFKTDGVSFADIFYNSLLSKKSANRKYSYGISMDDLKFSIYDGRYKYIYSQRDACLFNHQYEEFYDLKQDPGEIKNLMRRKITEKDKLKKELFNYISRNNLWEISKNQDNKAPYSQEIINELKSFGY